MQDVPRGSGPHGRAKGAEQKPAKAPPARTPSSPDGTGVGCMEASPPDHGPRKVRRG